MARKNRNAERIMEIEELIKKYNKKPEKKIRKKDLVRLMDDVEVVMPVKANLDEADFYSETVGGISCHPDIVKDGAKTRLLPVFTSFEQIPLDYMNSFSFIRITFADVYNLLNESSDLKGIVVNPFTECNLEIKKKRGIERKTSDTKHYGRSESELPDAMIIYQNKKYSITKTPFTIGREGTDIVIPESYISKIHVVISYKEGRLRIADYDSTNGTTVNGKELRPKVYYEIRDGFVIELSEKEKMVVYIN